MASTTPTYDLNSPLASSNGSGSFYPAHNGNALTSMHDEQVLKFFDNLPDDEALSCLFMILHRRQTSIPSFLDRQPSARPQLVALGKLADAPPTPAATPISIDQTPQALSPSIREGSVRDGQEQNKGLGLCLAAPPDSAPTTGDKHDSMPTDEMHGHVPSQEVSSQPVLATHDSMGNNEGAVSSPTAIQKAGLEHDGHRESVMDDTAAPEAVDGAVQHSTRTANVAQTVLVPQSQEDISSPSSPNARSGPRGRKRTADVSDPEPESEKSKKKSTADRVQEQLLADAIQLMEASVTVHDIIFVLERFARERDSMATRGGHDETDQHKPQQDLDYRQRWLNGLHVHEKGERWERCLQRVCAGLFYGQYTVDRKEFEERRKNEEQNKKKKGTLRHPIEMYIDMWAPETVILNGVVPTEEALVRRKDAKRAFQNEVQKKKPWVMMLDRYGVAIFLLLVATLREDHVRRLRDANLELLLDRFDERHPGLRDDLQGLSDHLSYFINEGRLPAHKLRFEELSRSELEAECFNTLALRDLFKPCEPPAANAPSESPSMNERSHEHGERALSEEAPVYASPPQDLSQLASPSLSSPRDLDQPLTPRTEVDFGTVPLFDTFDTATDAPGSPLLAFFSPLDNISARSFTDEAEFDYQHKQILASIDADDIFSNPVTSNI